MTPNTIHLAEATKALVDKTAREAGVSPGEFADQALQEALFLRKYRTLRDRLAVQARAREIGTDETFLSACHENRLRRR